MRICPRTQIFSVLPFHWGILEGGPTPLGPRGMPLNFIKSSEPRLFSKEGGDEISLRSGTFLFKLGLGGTGGGTLLRSVLEPPRGVDRPEEPLKGVGIFDLNGFGVKIVAGNEATDNVDPSRRNILTSESPTVLKD